jgi:hypothetical protein
MSSASRPPPPRVGIEGRGASDSSRNVLADVDPLADSGPDARDGLPDLRFPALEAEPDDVPPGAVDRLLLKVGDREGVGDECARGGKVEVG